MKFWRAGGQEDLGEGRFHLRRGGRWTVQLALLISSREILLSATSLRSKGEKTLLQVFQEGSLILINTTTSFRVFVHISLKMET